MKGASVILDWIGGREVAALVVDGRVEDFLADPPEDAPPAPGTIFRAIVDRPMKGQGGSLVRLPGDSVAFLKRSGTLAPGKPVRVQVTGYAEPGKAPPVSERLLFKSRYAIVTPDRPGINIARSIRDDDRRDFLTVIGREEMAGSDMGLILRSAAGWGDETAIREDIASMRELAETIMGDDMAPTPERLLDAPGAHDLAWCEWDRPEPYEVVRKAGALGHHGVIDALDALREPEAVLSSGGTMSIEATRACVAVDIDTGADTSAAAGFKANLAAVRELPRQLRLRGLGGQIVIDVAPMSKRHRRELETALKAAFRADSVETAFVGWTPLGHVELQRKRERLPLHLVLPE